MSRPPLVRGPSTWASIVRDAAPGGPVAKKIRRITSLHERTQSGDVGIMVGAGMFRHSEGYVAVVLRGSVMGDRAASEIRTNGFDDILGQQKRLGECCTYLTPEQALEFARRLVKAAAEAGLHLRDES